MTFPLPRPLAESSLAGAWFAGVRGPVRLEDGRALQVVFPGVPGGGAGPDAEGAVLEAGGDVLRGAVEFHILASGWPAHGHHRDPAYAAVVLHVVARNDSGLLATPHVSGRAIPILVLDPGPRAAPAPAFTPPCAFSVRRGLDPAPALDRLALRRLRMKAARATPLVAAGGPGQALYALLLETLGGPANRAAFAALARRLPLAALLDAAGARPPAATRVLAITAALRGEAASLSLRRAGLRPMAAPARRIEAAGALVAALWPAGAGAAWPPALPMEPVTLLRALRVPGVGRAAAIECAVNAALPVALAAGLLPEAAAGASLAGLPSPGVYGRLRRLESWLASAGGERPFSSAARLQGALLLHTDYCAAGRCGRCPLSG